MEGARPGQRLAGCTHGHVQPCLQGVAGESTGTAAAQSSFLAFVWGPQWDLAANRADLCSQQKLAMKAVGPRKQTKIQRHSNNMILLHGWEVNY